MIPKATKEAILAAMVSFDQERGFETDARFRGKHKYALKHGERLYPVKEIICRATGVGARAFSGGAQANRYLERLGFMVIEVTGK